MSSTAKRTPAVVPNVAAAGRSVESEPAHTIVAAAAAMMASLCIVYSLGLDRVNKRFSEAGASTWLAEWNLNGEGSWSSLRAVQECLRCSCREVMLGGHSDPESVGSPANFPPSRARNR